jgi:hypothetical protein
MNSVGASRHTKHILLLTFLLYTITVFRFVLYFPGRLHMSDVVVVNGISVPINFNVYNNILGHQCA